MTTPDLSTLKPGDKVAVYNMGYTAKFAEVRVIRRITPKRREMTLDNGDTYKSNGSHTNQFERRTIRPFVEVIEETEESR